MVPSFFVIGAYRSGTTALYRLMRQHPQVFLPLEKEPMFFAIDGNPDASDVLRSRSVKDRAEYEALYAPAEPGQVCGDISPEYLVNPFVPGRLASEVPDARLVVVLRNPVDRAWSDYLLHRRDGNETAESFAEALDLQAARITGGDHRAGHYIDTGMYAGQIERWLAHFDRSQLQVHLFEDVMGDTDATLAKVFSHVGVDPDQDIEPELPINASGIPKNKAVATALKARALIRPYVSRSLLEKVRPAWDRVLSRQLDRPTLTDGDRGTLIDIYRADVMRLSDLIDRDLTHWLETTS